VSAKAAFKLLEDGNRAFLLGSHVNDKFGAYTRYSTLAVGYGTQLLKREDKTVDVEVGPGYFHGESAAGEQESGMTVRGAAQLRWRVSPSAAFSADRQRRTRHLERALDRRDGAQHQDQRHDADEGGVQRAQR
jgi:putative salt-induced outer membrane protein